MKNSKGWGITLWCLLFIAGPSQASSLILTAPPRENVEAGNKIYGPLAKHLSDLIGAEVVYQHPKNWLNYQREMRDNRYDIIFDGPHFISWRNAHLKHDVLVKLPGILDFYLVTSSGNDKINGMDDLIGKKICGISPPNLSTLTVLDRFRNPVRQPVIVGVKGGMGKVYKSFKAGKCEAAVLRSTFFKKKLQQKQRDELKILFHSAPLPNQGISVSQRINASAKNKILQSLTLGDGTKISQPIVKRFGGKKAKSFIPAKNPEYAGHNSLLEGVIFGW
ncbi:MAG: phosphate/phosphite/phosphonate ABC transporter substrate-binding protein [Gammaproteobacteria bacterium]|nr:phosphate/phosphite/phosphonate ABC transporter substrate-binding protein [Gammaproteobacteria bacterium]